MKFLLDPKDLRTVYVYSSVVFENLCENTYNKKSAFWYTLTADFVYRHLDQNNCQIIKNRWGISGKTLDRDTILEYLKEKYRE